MTPSALALRTSSSSVSRVPSSGGLVADEVVEGGQVEGVAGDVEPGGAGVLAGAGWRSVTCQDCFPASRAPRAARGGWRWWATAVSIAFQLHEGSLGELFVDVGGGAGRGGGWPGRRAGPCTAPPQRSTSRQMRGSRCCRSRASAISFIPVSVATPRVAAGVRGERGDRRGAVAAERLVPVQVPPAGRRPTSRSRCRRWRGAARTTARRCELVRSAIRPRACAARARAGGASRSATSTGSSASVSNMCP